MPWNSVETAKERSVNIGPEGLAGDLVIPRGTRGVVLFAHGSGSSRFSSRNRFVARVLQEADFGTLLLDLLTPQEEQVDLRTTHLRFDIRLLAERLLHATRWLQIDAETKALPLGYFGASTGAGAALVAAARLPYAVSAIVSRGGRPDLAAAQLGEVKAPTLFIVGGRDERVLEWNESAFSQLTCEKRLDIVPKATHLFEERGALEKVAQLARQWFERSLAK